MEGLSNDVTHLVKMVLIGDKGVGKTSIMMRLMNKSFHNDQASSIGAEFFSCHYRCSRSFKVQFWDTPGAAHRANSRQIYYLGASIFFLVFDMHNRESFEHLSQWLEEIRWSKHTFTTEFKQTGGGSALVCLVGNKLDLVHLRTVTEEEATSFAKEYGLLYFEVSAKHGTHVRETFEAIMLAFDQLDADCRKAGGTGLTEMMEYYYDNQDEDEAEDAPIWVEYDGKFKKCCACLY